MAERAEAIASEAGCAGRQEFFRRGPRPAAFMDPVEFQGPDGMALKTAEPPLKTAMAYLGANRQPIVPGRPPEQLPAPDPAARPDRPPPP